jgi:hypothetical protein
MIVIKMVILSKFPIDFVSLPCKNLILLNIKTNQYAKRNLQYPKSG